MKLSTFNRIYFLCACSLAMIASPLAHAQGESLDVLVTNSLQRMNENKWSEALTMLDRATGMPRRNSVGFSENYVSESAPPFCLDEDSNSPPAASRQGQS